MYGTMRLFSVSENKLSLNYHLVFLSVTFDMCLDFKTKEAHKLLHILQMLIVEPD